MWRLIAAISAGTLGHYRWQKPRRTRPEHIHADVPNWPGLATMVACFFYMRTQVADMKVVGSQVVCGVWANKTGTCLAPVRVAA
eukprot:2781766-Rhodomonas_salina.4